MYTVYIYIYMCLHLMFVQPNSINTLLPSANGMGGDMSQPREAASDDSSIHPVSKKMSAPGILQPYNQVRTIISEVLRSEDRPKTWAHMHSSTWSVCVCVTMFSATTHNRTSNKRFQWLQCDMGKVFKMLRLNYVATAASFFRQTRILRMLTVVTV